MKNIIFIIVIALSCIIGGCHEPHPPTEQFNYAAYNGKPVNDLLNATGTSWSGFSVLQEPIGTLSGGIFRFESGLEIWVYIEGVTIPNYQSESSKDSLYIERLKSENLIGGMLYNHHEGRVVKSF